MRLSRRTILSAAVPVMGAQTAHAASRRKPFHKSELIFPLGALHSHSSCVVRCPNGDLLACFYQGSGERRADDVVVLGSRKRRGEKTWSEPFVLADTPGFPDCNPCMIIDPRGKLWLFWVTIQANEWHTGLLKARVSSDYQRASGPPRWESEQVVHLKPGAEFTRTVHAAVERDLAMLEAYPEALRPQLKTYLELRRKNAADKYFMRLGWMPRARPIMVDNRLLLPLYSDGFDFSLIASTEDWGANWNVSLPIVGDGPVQPSLVRKKNGNLVALFRDNGLPPQRVPWSESADGGKTWSPVQDLTIPNPGSGLEVIVLQDGRWLLIHNDTENGRHSLALSLSTDEGKTWKVARHLERDLSPKPVTASYPSLLQAPDGSLHCSYTYTIVPEAAQKDAQGRPLRESIKHAHFNLAWLEQGS